MRQRRPQKPGSTDFQVHWTQEKLYAWKCSDSQTNGRTLALSKEVVISNLEILILDSDSAGQDTPIYQVSDIPDYNKYAVLQRGNFLLFYFQVLGIPKIYNKLGRFLGHNFVFIIK